MNMSQFLHDRNFTLRYVTGVRWLGRTTFSTQTVELQAGLSATEHAFALAHECGHIHLREQGLATGGFTEELAATCWAVQQGYPLP